MKIFMIFIFFISFNNLYAYNLYEKNVEKEIFYDEELKINEKVIPIGCVTKSLTGATILLFSQEKENFYLFNDKNLDITIGELLKNRLNYLKSIKNLSEYQIIKKQYIEDILKFSNEDVLNTKVYKILNHTSFFIKDLNFYFIYYILQLFNFLPVELKNEIYIFAFQYFSEIYRKDINSFGYSNGGFMYLVFIMSLMTDEKSFYDEFNKLLLKPLNINNDFIPVDNFSKKELKSILPYMCFMSWSIYREEYSKICAWDFIYTEMDSFNGGLLVFNIKNLEKLLDEVSKMYLGKKNLLTNNEKEISNLFFKYKTYVKEKIYEDDEEDGFFYSLGTYIKNSNNIIQLKYSGNAFNFKSRVYYNYNNINENINKKYHFIYNNEFLKKYFFRRKYSDDQNIVKEFNNILLNSLNNLYNLQNNIEIDKLERNLRTNKKETLILIKNNIIKNIERKDILNYCNIYFKNNFGM